MIVGKKYRGGENMGLTKKWLKCALIRAIRTIAQTAIATIGTATLMGEVNWVAVASASLLAGVLSILNALTGLPEAKEE
jgi:hypothetical protein